MLAITVIGAPVWKNYISKSFLFAKKVHMSQATMKIELKNLHERQIWIPDVFSEPGLSLLESEIGAEHA